MHAGAILGHVIAQGYEVSAVSALQFQREQAEEFLKVSVCAVSGMVSVSNSDVLRGAGQVVVFALQFQSVYQQYTTFSCNHISDLTLSVCLLFSSRVAGVQGRDPGLCGPRQPALHGHLRGPGGARPGTLDIVCCFGFVFVTFQVALMVWYAFLNRLCPQHHVIFHSPLLHFSPPQDPVRTFRETAGPWDVEMARVSGSFVAFVLRFCCKC